MLRYQLAEQQSHEFKAQWLRTERETEQQRLDRLKETLKVKLPSWSETSRDQQVA